MPIPMLPQAAPDNRPFDSERYLTELKLDGIRLLLVHKRGKTLFYTKQGEELSIPILEEKLSLSEDMILDGELVLTDRDGRPDYSGICAWLEHNFQATVTYVAFDLLNYRGHPLHQHTLIERKMLLQQALPEDTTSLVKIRYVVGRGTDYYREVCAQKLEGVVLKDKLSKYHFGSRSSKWVTITNNKTV